MQQFYRDGCAKESAVVNEEVLEEMRLLRTENKTLMNNIVNLTENNSKNQCFASAAQARNISRLNSSLAGSASVNSRQ